MSSVTRFHINTALDERGCYGKDRTKVQVIITHPAENLILFFPPAARAFRISIKKLYNNGKKPEQKIWKH